MTSNDKANEPETEGSGSNPAARPLSAAQIQQRREAALTHGARARGVTKRKQLKAIRAQLRTQYGVKAAELSGEQRLILAALSESKRVMDRLDPLKGENASGNLERHRRATMDVAALTRQFAETLTPPQKQSGPVVITFHTDRDDDLDDRPRTRRPDDDDLDDIISFRPLPAPPQPRLLPAPVSYTEPPPPPEPEPPPPEPDRGEPILDSAGLTLLELVERERLRGETGRMWR